MDLFKLGIRGHLFILTCITIIPVVAVFWYMGASQRKQSINHTEQQIFQSILLFSERQASLITETEHILSVAANLPELQNEMSPTCDDALAKIITSSPYYSTIVLANNEGFINCCAVPLTKPIDISDREWFQRAHETKNFVVGNYIISRTSGYASLPLAYPVRDKNNQIKFVVGAALNLEKYSSIFDGLSLPQKSIIHITDNNGTILFGTDVNIKHAGVLLSEELGVAFPNDLGGKILTERGDIDQIHWYKRITVDQNQNHIYIIVSVPTEVVYATANTLFLLHLTIFTILLVIVFLFSWMYGSHSILKPIQSLTDTTTRIAAGQYNEAVGKSFLQGDFRNLEGALNDMAIKLQKQRDQRDFAELSLKESESKLKTYVASDIIGVWWLQLDTPISVNDPIDSQVDIIFNNGRITYCNDLYAKMYGSENSEEIIGKRMIDLAKGNPDRAKIQIRNFITNGYRLTNHEFEIELNSKKRVWFLMSSSAILDKENISLIMGSQLDITEFKRHENLNKALLNLVDYSGEKDGLLVLQKFLDEAERLTNSKIGFFHFVDDDQVNIELQTWSSNTLATMCEIADFEKHYPIEQAGIWTNCVMTKNVTIHNDYGAIIEKNGLPDGHAPLERELVVPVLRSNKVVAILGVGNKPTLYDDIDVKLLQTLSDTAWETVLRIRTEQRLQQTLDGLETQVKDRTHKLNQMVLELETIFETSRVGMVVLDDKRRVIKANRRHAEIFGYDSPSEIVGMSSSHFHLSDEQFNKFGQIYLKLVEGEILQTEIQMKRKDGEIIWCSLSGKALNHENPEDLSQGVLWVVDDITDRKNAESERQLLAQKLQAAHQLGKSGWWEYDIESDTVNWPEETYALYGLTPGEDLSYDKLLNLIQPDYHNHHNKQLKLMLENGKAEFSYVIDRPDGESRWIWARGEVEHDEAGKPRKLFGTLQDITEQKKAEEILQASENRFRTLFERNSSIMLLIDPKNGKIVEANNAASDFYGWEIGELTEMNIQDINTLSPEEIQTRMKETAISGSRYFIFNHKRKDGSTRDVEVFSSQLTMGDHELLCSIVHDITARKEAEQALRISQSRLQTLLDTASDGIHILDTKGNLVEFSRSFSKMLGYSNEEAAKLNVRDWEGSIPSKQVNDKIKELVAKPTTFETLHRRKDGSLFHAEINAKGITLNDQTYLYASSRDISERKQTEKALIAAREEAEKANRAKSTFLSSMSHELRTPLNAILGYTQIFSNDETLTAKQQSGISTIHLAGEHLLMIINDILDMSKIESGKIEMVLSEVHLDSFLKNIIDFHRFRAQQKRIDFIFEPSIDPHLTVMLDELRLRQILFNLLSNAIKFTERGYCRFQVKAVQKEDDETLLTFIVEDSGIGIKESDKNLIFEPFKQVGDRSKYSEGSGLGLAISKHLVRFMGGKLEVESPLNDAPLDEDVGVGSRFFFTVKAKKTFYKSSFLSEISQTFATGYQINIDREAPIRVLIVDDETSNRAVLRDTLQPIGFELQEAVDGNSVTATCIEFLPDIILMDLRMPRCDGFTALSQLKLNKELKDIPVIAISASTAEEKALEERCKAHGFDSFIQKPFTTSLLFEEIEKLLPITLVYKNKKSPEEKPYEQSITVERPQYETLVELSKLLNRGDISSIIHIAESYEQDGETRYKLFFQQVKEFAENFNLSELDSMFSQREE